MSDFVQVSRERFYEFVGPRDIVFFSKPMVGEWKFREGKMLGKTVPGYLCRDDEGKYQPEKTYFLLREYA